ncbi:hypothetical protein ACOSP7_019869 [Xanthoceras sorbifolium]
MDVLGPNSGYKARLAQPNNFERRRLALVSLPSPASSHKCTTLKKSSKFRRRSMSCHQTTKFIRIGLVKVWQIGGVSDEELKYTEENIGHLEADGDYGRDLGAHCQDL